MFLPSHFHHVEEEHKRMFLLHATEPFPEIPLKSLILTEHLVLLITSLLQRSLFSPIITFPADCSWWKAQLPAGFPNKTHLFPTRNPIPHLNLCSVLMPHWDWGENVWVLLCLTGASQQSCSPWSAEPGPKTTLTAGRTSWNGSDQVPKMPGYISGTSLQTSSGYSCYRPWE